MKLKCSLHIHTDEEPQEWLLYDAIKLIDEAKKQKFDVLAFTCHEFFYFPKKIIDYTKKNDITLIPGVEAKIEGKHVLLLNTDKEAASLKTFSQLKTYKKKFPNCMVIAPHPYFPSYHSLFSKLEENIGLFDGIELSHFYTKFLDFNRKAKRIAEKNNLSFIGTSDVHLMSQLKTTYTIVDS